jgi:hypothetical protein
MDAQGYAQSVDDAINQTAATAGMDPSYWRAIASIESSLNPSSNYDKYTQYKGLYQVGTRDRPGEPSEWTRHGSGSVYNPMDNARSAAALAAENNAKFQSYYGRAPSPIETYMMHQQGFGFYKDGTMTNIAGNPYPGMRGPQTPQSFEAGWARELERQRQRAGESSAGQFPPSVAGTRYASAAGPSGVPSGATAGPTGPGPVSPAPSGDQGEEGGPDYGAQLANIRDQIAQQDQANQGPALQPMELAQPMMTLAMYRARLMAQAMMNRDMGGTPGNTGNTA